jgi:hypothetical protein
MTSRQLELMAGIAVNVFCAIPYIWIMRAGNEAPGWLALPLLAWGFVCFRWIARHLFAGSFMHVSVRLGTFFTVYAVGTLVCSVLGFLIIPVAIGYHFIQLVATRTT